MRLVLAVVLGFALWSALWLGGDVLLRGLFPDAWPADFPERPMTAAAPLVAALVLSVACSLVAGFASAKAGGRSRRTAVAVLALLLLAVGVAVQASAWQAMPLWYHLPFLILLVPVAWIGGRLGTPRAA